MTHSRLALLVVLILPLRSARADEASELAKYDEKVLKDAGIGTNGNDVLAFFRKRTLSADDLRSIPLLIKQLGDNDFDRREQASQKLKDFGPPVVALLQTATQDADAEVSRRS